MTATTEIDAATELELSEVRTGPPAKAVLGAGALCALFVAYALFSALTGGLGMVTLLLLVLGLAGGFYVYKQVAGAEDGELKELRDNIASRSKASSLPEPSVRVRGDLLDI